MTLMAFPACVLDTPEDPACSKGTVVEAANDPVAGTLTAQVEADPDPLAGVDSAPDGGGADPDGVGSTTTTTNRPVPDGSTTTTTTTAVPDASTTTSEVPGRPRRRCRTCAEEGSGASGRWFHERFGVCGDVGRASLGCDGHVCGDVVGGFPAVAGGWVVGVGVVVVSDRCAVGVCR